MNDDSDEPRPSQFDTKRPAEPERRTRSGGGMSTRRELGAGPSLTPHRHGKTERDLGPTPTARPDGSPLTTPELGRIASATRQGHASLTERSSGRSTSGGGFRESPRTTQRFDTVGTGHGRRPSQMATQRPRGGVMDVGGAPRTESGAWLPASIAVIALLALGVVSYQRWFAEEDDAAGGDARPVVAFTAPAGREMAPPVARATPAGGRDATDRVLPPIPPQGGPGVMPAIQFYARPGGTAEVCGLDWTRMYGRGSRGRSPPVSTPLHDAVAQDRGEAVERLLRSGVDVDVRNASRETPLMVAARLGSVESLERLLQAGASVDARDHLNHTALMHAAGEQRDDHVRALMRAGADGRARGLWDERGGSMTALDAAWARDGRRTARLIQGEILRVLAALEGRDLLGVDEAGDTPLHWAVRYSGANMTRLLIEKGAGLEVKNCPTRAGDERGPRRDDVRGATPLLVAVAAGDVDVVGALLDAGANVRAVDDRGRGVFHLLRQRSSLALVTRFLAQGADPALRDASGQPPAEALAALGLRLAFVQALRARGVRIKSAVATSEDLFGLLAKLGSAPGPLAERDDAARVEELLSSDFLLATARDEQGRSALAVAASFGLSEIVRALAARGAEVDARDASGRSPLHGVVDPKTIRALVELGADPNGRDRSGDTPLHVLARRPGSLDAVRVLLELGAQPKLKNRKQRDAAAVARERGNDATAIFLSR